MFFFLIIWLCLGLSNLHVLTTFVLHDTFPSQGGIYIFTLLDQFVSVLFVMLTSVIECVIIGWLYGKYTLNRLSVYLLFFVWPNSVQLLSCQFSFIVSSLSCWFSAIVLSAFSFQSLSHQLTGCQNVITLSQDVPFFFWQPVYNVLPSLYKWNNWHAVFCAV